MVLFVSAEVRFLTAGRDSMHQKLTSVPESNFGVKTTADALEPYPSHSHLVRLLFFTYFTNV